ncbi:MAG: hypothetical protein RLY70_377, partial [Planctomycetota bacterium]
SHYLCVELDRKQVLVKHHLPDDYVLLAQEVVQKCFDVQSRNLTNESEIVRRRQGTAPCRPHPNSPRPVITLPSEALSPKRFLGFLTRTGNESCVGHQRLSKSRRRNDRTRPRRSLAGPRFSFRTVNLYPLARDTARLSPAGNTVDHSAAKRRDVALHASRYRGIAVSRYRGAVMDH